MPIVYVTSLGSNASDVGSSVGQIIDYLERGTQTPQPNASPTIGYYADSADGPGVWRGRGVDGHQLIGAVDPEVLREILLGNHPVTSEPLVDATGSAGRASLEREAPENNIAAGPPDQLLTVAQVAALIQTTERYVVKLANEAAKPKEQTSDFSNRAKLHGAQLGNGSWVFRRDEVERFAAARKEPKVVVAYDLTISVEKSISLAWVQADDNQRRLIDEAIDHGVNAAVHYLEQHAIAVRRGRGSEPVDGVWAASYRHLTNRNLEPQIHEHVLISNVAAPTRGGDTQAIDARGLMHHSKTAGYVAGAVIRNHLSTTLGVEWNPAERGIADLAGVPRVAIDAMSTRRQEVMSVANELGLDTLTSRQYAALTTRAPKQNPTDWNELERTWRTRLEALGFSRTDWLQLTDATRRNIAALTNADIDNIAATLHGPDGVTKHSGIFGRREVIQHVIDFDAAHGSNRLTYETIERLTDTFLASRDVIPVVVPAHQSVRTGEARWYTTTQTLQLEADVIAAYRDGLDRNIAAVNTDTVKVAINEWQHNTGQRLGGDQAEMVEQICMTTDRFAIVVGAAGSGKTSALEVAARAWEQSGWKPLGLSVTGAATDQLAASTGIPTRTVASLLAAIDAGHQPLEARTIVIVDEASTLSNRDHRALTHAVTNVGARMVTIGDPAQHTAVEAGGLWAHLVNELNDRAAHLTANRRQSTTNLDEVRLANADYRNGRINAALTRLTEDNRITTADTASQLLDELVADWYVDRQHHTEHGGPASRMMAEHHNVRHQLNRRAQALLTADGTLTGPGIHIGDATFHIGDEVVTRTRDANIRFNDGSTMRNSSHGTITAITTNPDGKPTVTVNFEHRGPVDLNHDFLTRPIRPGVTGGLTPAYAVTTHVAQGSTYKAGRMIATDSSTRAGIYVGLTRGTTDVRLYAVRRDQLNPTERSDIGLPAIIDTKTANEALAKRLSTPEAPTVVATTDPNAERVTELLRRPIAELRELATTDRLASRAIDIIAKRMATRALTDPSEGLVAVIGERPPATSARRPKWDQAATAVVTHTTKTGTTDLTALSDNMRATINEVALAHRASEEVLRIAEELKTTRSQLPLNDAGTRAAQSLLRPFITKAVDQPADYITAVLGPRPEGGDARSTKWTAAATAIETWRHEHGLTPADGPSDLGNTALRRAAGPNPEGLAEVQRFGEIYRTVSEALAPTPNHVQRVSR